MTSSTTSASCLAANSYGMAMRNVPAGDWNVAAASSETSRSRWNNGPASRSRASPASVSRRRRVLRSNRRTPIFPSSRDTAVLTEDLGNPSRSAARVKLPSVATVQKVSQSFQSVVRIVEQ